MTHENINRISIAVTILSAVFFILPKMVLAQVIFNEIAWMGSTTSANDEWLELYNNDSNAVDLVGWKIVFLDKNLVEKFTVTFSEEDPIKQIPGLGYFLLERTDDTTVPNIIADKIYTGALNNDGGILKLFSAQDNLIDEINNTEKWIAGDSAQKLTMEKTGSGSWQNSAEPNGTPKSPNSVGAPAPTPSHSAAPTPAPTPTPSVAPSPAPSSNQAATQPSTSPTPAPVGPTFDYSQDIFINEFMPAPPNDEQEWLELINTGERDVNLSGWQIDDEANSTKPQTIPENTVIMPNKYLVIAFGKSTLNNDGDRVRLLWPDDQVVHSVAYEKTKSGWAAAKFDAGWLWTNQPTPGAPNRKSFTANEESISLANAPAGANKMTTIEDAVTVNAETTPQPTSSGAASLKMTPNNQPVPAIADGAINNQMPTGAAAPNTNLTAAAANTPPKNSGLNAALGLIGVILLSAVTAGALIYFKRKTAAQD